MLSSVIFKIKSFLHTRAHTSLTFIFDFAEDSKNAQLFHCLARFWPCSFPTTLSSSKSHLFPTRIMGTYKDICEGENNRNKQQPPSYILLTKEGRTTPQWTQSQWSEPPFKKEVQRVLPWNASIFQHWKLFKGVNLLHGFLVSDTYLMNCTTQKGEIKEAPRAETSASHSLSGAAHFPPYAMKKLINSVKSTYLLMVSQVWTDLMFGILKEQYRERNAYFVKPLMTI